MGHTTHFAKKVISSLCIFALGGIWSSTLLAKTNADIDLNNFLNAGEKVQIILLLKDKKMNKQLCQQLEKSFSGKMNSKCYYSDKDLPENRFNQYKLVATSEERDEVTLSFSLIHPQEDDIKQIHWPLKNLKSKKFNDALKRVSENVIEYDRYAKDMKDVLFYFGLNESRRVAPAGDMFNLYSKDGVLQGTVNKELAMREYYAERNENRNFLRASLEVATFLGIGKGLYMLGHDSMQEDWDFDNSSVSDFKKRIFSRSQLKFDDNAVSMNWGHAYAGVLYYSSARNNGFKSYESLMVSLASSSIWEYLGEYKEVVSINDQVITGLGGAIIGETLFQISNMLKRRDSTTAKVIGAIINPVGSINDLMDGKGLFHAHENFTRKLGFDSEGISQMDLLSGIRMVSNRKDGKKLTMAEVGFDSSVVNLPIEDAGEVHSLVVDTMMAELFALGSVSENGIEDWKAVTKIALAGYFSKSVSVDEEGKLAGHSFFIAPAFRTEYNSEGPAHSHDFYAMVNVLGGTMDVTFFQGGNKLRFSIDVYADFAMVRPYGLEQFQDQGGSTDNAKSVLAKRGYYYAAGATGIMKLSYASGKNEFGVSYTRHQFESIDNKNLNRHIDLVTDDYSMEDTMQSVRVYYTRDLSTRYKMSVGLEKIFRDGKMTSINTGEESFSKSDVDTRFWLQMIMKL